MRMRERESKRYAHESRLILASQRYRQNFSHNGLPIISRTNNRLWSSQHYDAKFSNSQAQTTYLSAWESPSSLAAAHRWVVPSPGSSQETSPPSAMHRLRATIVTSFLYIFFRTCLNRARMFSSTLSAVIWLGSQKYRVFFFLLYRKIFTNDSTLSCDSSIALVTFDASSKKKKTKRNVEIR